MSLISALLVFSAETVKAENDLNPYAHGISDFEMDDCRASFDLSALVKKLELAIHHYDLMQAQFFQSPASQNLPVHQEKFKFASPEPNGKEIEFSLKVHQLNQNKKPTPFDDTILEGAKNYASLLTKEILKHDPVERANLYNSREYFITGIASAIFERTAKSNYT